jgi:hypothetical protein
MSDIWEELGIEATEDVRTIRRAYATRLRRVDREGDPDGFQRLREAYEAALEWSEGDGMALPTDPDPSDIADTASHDDSAPIEGDRYEAEDEPWDGLLAQVLAAVESGDGSTAADRLRNALNSPLLETLDDRHRFEIRLLDSMPPFASGQDAFVTAAVEAFRWQDSVEHLPPYHSAMAADLVSRRDDELVYRFLKAYSRFRWLTYILSKQALATSVLTGPFRPTWFKWLAANRHACEHITEMLSSFIDEHPGLVQRLDHRTVDWWLNVDDRHISHGWAIIYWLRRAYLLHATLATGAIFAFLPQWREAYSPAYSLLALAYAAFFAMRQPRMKHWLANYRLVAYVFTALPILIAAVGFFINDYWFVLVGVWLPLLCLVCGDGTERYWGGVNVVFFSVIAYMIFGWLPYSNEIKILLLAGMTIFASRMNFHETGKT